MSAPVPVGLVGAGKHGERYLRHIATDVPELAVRLLWRRDAALGREQAAGLGARFVEDVRELVSSPEIRAVILVAPPTLNPALTAAAAKAGKAILVEKPLAVSVAAGRQIRDSVERAGVPAMVAQTLRYNSVVAAVRSELGRLGALHQVVLNQRFEKTRLAWLDDPATSGGGNLLHTGVHSFDLVRVLTGQEPAAVVAKTARVYTRRTEDSFAALFTFADRLLASVSGSRATSGRSGGIEVVGEHGQLVADHVHGWAYRFSGTSQQAIDVPPPAQTVLLVLRDFVRVVGGAPAPITLTDGLRAVAMAEACYRSADSGSSEPVTPT